MECVCRNTSLHLCVSSRLVDTSFAKFKLGVFVSLCVPASLYLLAYMRVSRFVYHSWPVNKYAVTTSVKCGASTGLASHEKELVFELKAFVPTRQ